MHGPVIGVLLAAGRGLRYDPSGTRLKLLAPAAAGAHAGAPLAVAAARSLRGALRELVAVVRPIAGTAPPNTEQQLHTLLVDAGCTLVTHANADDGLGSSIAAGVRAVQTGWPDAAGVLVALADMPAIRRETIAAVARAVAGGAMTAAPAFEGRRGHPVGFARALFGDLIALRGDRGAQPVLQRHPPCLLATDDPGVLLDVDHAD